MSLPKYVCRYHINRCSLMIYCGASGQAGDRVGGRHGKTGGLQGLQQMLTAFFSFWHYTSKSIRMTYSYLLLETISVSKLAAWAEISGFLSLLCERRNCDADWICVYVNVRGGCVEEAVFGPRLKCRTRVPAPGKETSRAETRGTCLPSGKHVTRLK